LQTPGLLAQATASGPSWVVDEVVDATVATEVEGEEAVDQRVEEARARMRQVPRNLIDL